MEACPDDIEVYLSLRSSLIDYATPIIGCRARAEDVVQEAYIRFTQRRQREVGEQTRDDQLSKVIEPEPYLYRIVRNVALDWLRRPDSETTSFQTHNETDETTAPNPETVCLHQERLRRLATALAELPERKRTAFNMHRLEGKSLQEVANHLDISVVRAHQLVKDCIRHGLSRLDPED